MEPLGPVLAHRPFRFSKIRVSPSLSHHNRPGQPECPHVRGTGTSARCRTARRNIHLRSKRAHMLRPPGAKPDDERPCRLRALRFPKAKPGRQDEHRNNGNKTADLDRPPRAAIETTIPIPA